MKLKSDQHVEEKWTKVLLLFAWWSCDLEVVVVVVVGKFMVGV